MTIESLSIFDLIRKYAAAYYPNGYVIVIHERNCSGAGECDYVLDAFQKIGIPIPHIFKSAPFLFVEPMPLSKDNLTDIVDEIPPFYVKCYLFENGVCIHQN